jgi:phage shock protein PspC (stress-responsive transcriptional regulator)
MTDVGGSSLEQLDSLLEAGKISQADYETLRKTMESKNAEELKRQRQESRPRLCKSWTNRQLGGVCGGFAEYFGLNARTLRLIVFLGALLSFGTVVLVYLALYLILPWDEGPRPLADERKRLPWGFAAMLGSLWVIHTYFLAYVEPRIEATLADMGVALPLGTRLAISLDHWCRNPVGILAQLMVLGLVLAIYLILPSDRRARQIFGWAVFLGFVFLLCFYAYALGIPLQQLVVSIHEKTRS